jgi:hypothetical protein
MPDDARDLAAERHRVLEHPVGVPDEDQVGHPEPYRAFPLLALASGGELAGPHGRVLAPLVAAREQQEGHLPALGGPLRDRRRAPVLGIVGVRRHHQDTFARA